MSVCLSVSYTSYKMSDVCKDRRSIDEPCMDKFWNE